MLAFYSYEDSRISINVSKKTRRNNSRAVRKIRKFLKRSLKANQSENPALNAHKRGSKTFLYQRF
jgi:ribosomal protein L31E